MFVWNYSPSCLEIVESLIKNKTLKIYIFSSNEKVWGPKATDRYEVGKYWEMDFVDNKKKMYINAIIIF